MALRRNDVLGQLARLAMIYHLKDMADREAMRALTDEWEKALRGLSEDQLERGVTSYIRYDTTGFFPTPGQIRDYAKRFTDSTTSRLTLDREPCSACGAIPVELPNGRMNITHDQEKHAAFFAPIKEELHRKLFGSEAPAES